MSKTENAATDTGKKNVTHVFHSNKIEDKEEKELREKEDIELVKYSVDVRGNPLEISSGFIFSFMIYGLLDIIEKIAGIFSAENKIPCQFQFINTPFPANVVSRNIEEGGVGNNEQINNLNKWTDGNRCILKLKDLFMNDKVNVLEMCGCEFFFFFLM
jgi:hypothetical protein